MVTSFVHYQPKITVYFTSFRYLSRVGPAFWMYLLWYAMPAVSTILANTPSDFSFDTNASMLFTGPDMVQFVALFRQATSTSCGNRSLISLYPSPACNSESHVIRSDHVSPSHLPSKTVFWVGWSLGVPVCQYTYNLIVLSANKQGNSNDRRLRALRVRVVHRTI